ncbi:MAG: MptD family putative ECF transporter S component [Planctomycetes bacterium]|nr:MptD family putative ECF transporter S component [Planctomycetota bacterium]
MAISLKCKCGETVRLKDDYSGHEADCPSCGATLPVPANAITSEPGRRPRSSDDDDDRRHGDDSRDVDVDLRRMTSHGGPVLPVDADLFARPPREIGDVRSAETSLRRGDEPTTMGMRLGICGGILGVGVVMGIFVAVGGALVGGPAFVLLAFGIVLVALIIASIVFWYTGFSHTCSYVGTKGIAVYYCSGDRESVYLQDLFIYADADDLRVAQTRQYVNGRYTGTTYSFTWATRDGTEVFSLTGTYHSELGTPAFEDAYYFALGAEAAWTNHLAELLDRDIAAGKLITFRLDSGDCIRLGPSTLILEQGGGKITLKGRDLNRITIQEGIVKIWQPGGEEGWFSNEGVYQFAFGSLANAKLFIFAVQRLLGNVFG